MRGSQPRPSIFKKAPESSSATARRLSVAGLFRMPIDRAFASARDRARRDRHGRGGDGGGGRAVDDQPARHGRAGPRAAYPKPAGRDVPPPASAAPSTSPVLFRRRGAAPRRLASRARAARAGQTARSFCARVAFRRGAAARRAAGASASRHQPIPSAAPQCLGRGRSPPARPVLSRSISIIRSARSRATARCCATTRRGIPWPADGSSTRLRRGAAAGSRPGSPCSRRQPTADPAQALGAPACGRRGGRSAVIRAGAQPGAGRARCADKKRATFCASGRRAPPSR